MRLGHVGIPVKDLSTSKRFYDAISGALALEKIDHGETSSRYGADGMARFYIHTRSEPTSSIHLCFEVSSQKDVDAFYKAALTNGGQDHGAPGLRLDYSPTYYAAFVLDPDGNNIEAVFRG